MAKGSRGNASGQKSQVGQPLPECLIHGDGASELIPVQLGDHICWAVRSASCIVSHEPAAAKPFGDIGPGRISGWLRIADESYVLVSEADDTVASDRLRDEINAWDI